MSRYLTPLPGLLAAAVEFALRRAASRDPDAGAGIARLEGRHLCFELTGLGIDLWFTAADGEMRVRAEAPGDTADTTITGSPLALLSLAVPDAGGPGTAVQIRGDAQLAQDFQKFFRRLDPDWEAAFSEYLGPVLGPQAFDAMQRGRHAARDSVTTAGDQLAHWLRDESGLVPGRGEWDRFAREVDALREAADRLEGRLRRAGRT